jgi:hypothetical protein
MDNVLVHYADGLIVKVTKPDTLEVWNNYGKVTEIKPYNCPELNGQLTIAYTSCIDEVGEPIEEEVWDAFEVMNYNPEHIICCINDKFNIGLTHTVVEKLEQIMVMLRLIPNL